VITVAGSGQLLSGCWSADINYVEPVAQHWCWFANYAHTDVTGFSGKSADDADYSAKQAHVELAMRMRFVFLYCCVLRSGAYSSVMGIKARRL
jgi:hypothetical protein